MKNNSESHLKENKYKPKILLTLTTIYAVLYTVLLLSFLVFEYSYSNITYQGIVTGLAIIIFFVGYYYSWKNEKIAGTIFIIWWGIMWYIGYVLSERDRGVAVVMGFPMFIIGILFIIYWYKKNIKKKNN